MTSEDISKKMGEDYEHKENVTYMEVVDGQQRLTNVLYELHAVNCR